MRQYTNEKAVWSRRIWASLMLVGLAALLFLGSPGCNCGDNLPQFPPVQARDCCCEFEWIQPATTPGIADVDIVLSGVDPSLQAYADPPVLLGVTTGTPQLFQICVRDDHTLGATLTLEFRDQSNNAVLGSAQLVYNVRCDPTIVPITQRLLLTSTDCVDPCCCNFRWLAPDTVLPTVDINILNSSGGLRATITPNPLTGVMLMEWSDFQICVNDDHPVPSTLQIEFRNGVNLYAQATLSYNASCIPDINFTPAPNLPGQALYSTDCGPIPPCCCTVEYTLILPAGGFADLLFEAETPVGSTLPPVTITPSTFNNVPSQGPPVTMQVCVQFGHDLGEPMDLIVRDSNTLAELGRIALNYGQHCVANPGVVTGFGTWIINCP